MTSRVCVWMDGDHDSLTLIQAFCKDGQDISPAPAAQYLQERSRASVFLSSCLPVFLAFRILGVVQIRCSVQTVLISGSMIDAMLVLIKAYVRLFRMMTTFIKGK